MSCVARKYSTDFPCALVESYHRLPTMAIEEQRMNRLSFDIIENRPESETSNPVPDAVADERKGCIAPLALDQ